ncbi:MAG: tyrosine-protein phosphatase [Coriobacteriales bacterium]|nr:tyrosine-protein phosphatase [Coriobacteriales bacterium]
MGLRERWKAFWEGDVQDLEPARKLDLHSGFNVRELGGYAVDGGETRYRRFLRSGGLDMLSQQDQRRLHAYGVRLVVDLRGNHEVEVARDKLGEMRDVRCLHVPVFDLDMSDPKLERGNDEGSYFTLGYLTMLGNHDAMGRIFSFFATAAEDECVLFHCAAGMDRTGMVAMLVLGLAGASRDRIVADYCYSFASQREVDRMVYGGEQSDRRELLLRHEAITTSYDRLVSAYGSVREYLLQCGVTNEELDRVRAHLVR